MSNWLLKIKKVFSTTAASLAVLFSLTSFFAIPAVKADSILAEPQNYSIQFLDKSYASDLTSVGSEIRQRFVSSQDEEFKNIYSFNSSYSLSYLQNYFHGEFSSLDINRNLAADGVVVNDPGFATDSQNIDKEWGLIKAGFDVAWEKTVGSNDNTIAVIDTGIDETHNDLSSADFVPGFDFTTNRPLSTGVDSDDNGHGTLVAGVLGATPNNGIGIVGTNWQVALMPLKALTADGKGDANTIAEAIVWATDHGAQFINLSVGGIGFGQDTVLSNAISYAFNRNVLIVAAAGNDTATTGGNEDTNPVYPVCDDNNFNMIIGVTATDQNDLKPEFANYGHNCIDVSAPGKRILSTINFDPLTKRHAPNSYAYGSGTSLAVPFVVGEAALIKALYPSASNVQIRDRIISTADSVDKLNLYQCAGSPCRGLVGAGRINVAKAIQTDVSQNFTEGELLKATDTGAVYQILGGQKRLVSPFVLNQKFANIPRTPVLSSQLNNIPDGPYITPTDGTLVKYDKNPTVYEISNGQKLPVTYQVFTQRQFNFSNVSTLSVSELDSWVTGAFLPPVDGTLLRTARNKTVYWVVGGTLHPINSAFYKDRGLSIFPVLIVADRDIEGYPQGEAYIR